MEKIKKQRLTFELVNSPDRNRETLIVRNESGEGLILGSFVRRRFFGNRWSKFKPFALSWSEGKFYAQIWRLEEP